MNSQNQNTQEWSWLALWESKGNENTENDLDRDGPCCEALLQYSCKTSRQWVQPELFFFSVWHANSKEKRSEQHSFVWVWMSNRKSSFMNDGCLFVSWMWKKQTQIHIYLCFYNIFHLPQLAHGTFYSFIHKSTLLFSRASS